MSQKTMILPGLVSLPCALVATQVKIPTSDDVTLYTVNVFSMVVIFNNLDAIMYLLLLYIITSLKYQLMFGTGSPTA